MLLKKCLFFLFLMSCITVSAQQADTAFQKQWKEIDTLIIGRNLTKSALEKVNTLYKQAIQRNDEAQQIKALIYRYSLEDKVNELNPNRSIATVKDAIGHTNNTAAKSILYSLEAKLFQNYFNNNRYRFYNRSNTTDLKKDDIATWSTDDFHAAIAANYLKSLEAADVLQHTKLESFDAIIIKGNARNLRPTLYDLLAHEALDYFKSGDSYFTKPSYAFVVDDSKALGTIAQFLNTRFISKDSASGQLISLQVFQKLISFHLNDPLPDALIDADIERIQWVNGQGVFENKETFYTTALKELTSRFSKSDAAEAWYLFAKMDADKARDYNPFGDTTHRYNYIKAEKIISEILPNTKERSLGNIHMQNLLSGIKQKNIQLQTENVNIPGKPFRTLVTYRNTDTLYARIIDISDNDSIRSKYINHDFWEYASSLSVDKGFKQKLPATYDHQTHFTEISIDALPVGEYAILVSTSKEFEADADQMAIQYFYISGLSYIKNNNDYFVLDRETGEPINRASVSIFKKNYERARRGYSLIEISTKETDSHGWFGLDESLNEGALEFSIETSADKLHIHNNEYVMRRNEPSDRITKNIFFFTDRAIYRPGQKVFFKGIAVTTDEKTRQSKLYVQKDSIRVYLCDVNGKFVDSVRCLQNEFGSVASNLTIPQNVLTGYFRLSTETIVDGSASFRVEEYKRPKFYVAFEKVKGAYRLGDSIHLTGSAKAYAGNNIDGALVKFNVKRRARYMYEWVWRGGNPPNNNSQEIVHGEMTTGTDGKFTISFKALADLSVDRSTSPIFDFSVEAIVTDINGETRTNSANVSVAYQSLLLQIIAPSIAEKDSLHHINISTTNMAGEKETTDVGIKIYPLESPGRVVRKRYWQRPDQFVLNRERYLRLFPTDDYDNDNSIASWAKGEILADKTIHANDKGEFSLDNVPLTSGYYRIEASAFDKYNQPVKDVRYIEVFDRNSTHPPVPENDFTYTVKEIVQPGEKALFFSGCSSDQLFVLRQVFTPLRKNNSNFDFLLRKKGIEQIAYTPSEAERGGVAIHEIFVKNNRVYNNTYNIRVPWTNKELNVHYTSYRDKTEPGSNEKWTVTLSGKKGEKVAAELLTGMYDASLDQFAQNSWETPYNMWPNRYYTRQWRPGPHFTSISSIGNSLSQNQLNDQTSYDKLAQNESSLANAYLSYGDTNIIYMNIQVQRASQNLSEVVVVAYGTQRRSDVTGLASTFNLEPAPSQALEGKVAGAQIESDLNPFRGNVYEYIHIPSGGTNTNDLGNIQIRKNLSETAFFFPQLHADSSGNFSFSFTMPEALTQWKWMSLAHTKDLSFGTQSASITTQKTLMVQPNAPRFMREGDQMEFVTKIANLSDKELTGQASLELIDATTNTSVDGWFVNVFPVQYFTVGAGQSSSIKFPIQVPFSYNRPLTWRIVAKAGDYSDGEENTLPVITNRMLVTESMPLLLNGDTTQHFTFSKLLNTTSETLTHQDITVEYTANPAWYAVQALPYLIEYPYECAEQTFNRFYANALASFIVNKHPRIKDVFEKWKSDTTALKSNLQKNQELKQILLEETPWVLQAENETQQKKNIALLFDVVTMSNSMQSALEKVKQAQLSNGAFTWFKGGYEDRYMTNYIMTGIGKLKKAGALAAMDNATKNMIKNALQYLDGKATEDYQNLIRYKAKMDEQQLYSFQIQYLYMRSFFPEEAITNKEAYNYYYAQAKKYWVKQSLYNQALLGLIFYRNDDKKIAISNILPSITENSVASSTQGMYWKETYTNWWYQSPIEFQSLVISFMSELNQTEKNQALSKNISDMKTWLILNKQTNNWKTTIATADACSALLLNGEDLLNNNKQVTIQLGDYRINSSNETTEAGTGYFKKRIEANAVKPAMGNIIVTTQSSLPSTNTSISYGSVYWQYFEDMDRITEASSPLSLHRKLFIEKNTDKGKLLSPINENDEVKVGDKVIVRIELKSDRDMEYLHLKDTRAACMEPINVLSGYKWQDGLGYYEATADASTNFFINNLHKGTYVFEYPLYITHVGRFSAGLATIQCMYAPEFGAHSEGIKIRVE